jgi:hypothetical protein
MNPTMGHFPDNNDAKPALLSPEQEEQPHDNTRRLCLGGGPGGSVTQADLLEFARKYGADVQDLTIEPEVRRVMIRSTLLLYSQKRYGKW